MPAIEPTNLQQVLQMSSAVEKVQAQQVQHLAADQIQDQEREQLDEAKRVEMQDPEESNPVEPTHPDSGGRRRRIRIKKAAGKTDKEAEENQSAKGTSEESQGSHLDIVV